MPQAEHAGPRRYLPGVYGWLRERAVKQADGVDPRAELDGGVDIDARPRCLKTYLPVDDLEAGIPAVIPAWLLGGHSWPQARDWPQHRSVKAYRVFSDDRVEPFS